MYYIYFSVISFLLVVATKLLEQISECDYKKDVKEISESFNIPKFSVPNFIKKPFRSKCCPIFAFLIFAFSQYYSNKIGTPNFFTYLAVFLCCAYINEASGNLLKFFYIFTACTTVFTLCSISFLMLMQSLLHWKWKSLFVFFSCVYLVFAYISTFNIVSNVWIRFFKNQKILEKVKIQLKKLCKINRKKITKTGSALLAILPIILKILEMIKKIADLIFK